MTDLIFSRLPQIMILLTIIIFLSAVLLFSLSRAKQKTSDSHPVRTYLAFYSLTFVLLTLLVFSPNFVLGKALVWQTDAVPQYIPYLKYMGEYIRSFIANLFQGNFTPKMYDFHIGLGADIRTVFRTHPLEFLSAFVPSKYVEILYNFLMFFRFYIAGLTFTAYCRYRRKSWRNSFIASFIYIFSGFTLVFGARHPIFSAPLILLPLLLLTLDKLIQKKSPLQFTAVVGLSLFTNYYYLYMCTICMGVYALIRFFQCFKTNRISEFLRMMGRIIVYYLFGCALAAISFFPNVVDLFSSNRVGSSDAFVLRDMLFYNSRRIINLFICSISSLKSAGYTTYLGYAVPVLPALAAVFMKKKKEYTGLKIALVIEYIALLMPLSGFVMSGFSTVNNRWTFAVAFTAAFAVACVLDDFTALTKAQRRGMAAVTVLYGAAFVYACPGNIEILFTFLLLAASTVLLLHFAKTGRRQVYTVFSLLTALSLVIHGAYLYGNFSDPYTSEFVRNGTATNSFLASPFNRFANLEEDEFYRIDSDLMRATKENLPVSVGYNGVSLYNSIISSPVISYHCDLSNIGISAVHRIWSLDGRTAMEALANVKYYMVQAGKDQYVPYGFTKDESLSDDEYWVYENNHLLSIGYTYDTCISKSEYDSMTALERQQAMLSGVVLGEDCDVPGLSSLPSDYDSGILTVTPEIISQDDGVIFDGSTCHIEKKDTGLTLSYEKRAGYEAYLHLGDFNRNIYLNTIKVSTSDLTKSFVLRGLNQDYSLGRSDYVINLGYSREDSSDTVKITFPKENADYEIGKIEICYVPMEQYEQKIDALNAQALENVTVADNTVSGTATLSKDGFMAFSIPYSSGWKAYVDGEETKIYQANTAYMGIALKEGRHEIVLKYTTPGLIPGTVITIASLILLLILLFRSRKKRCLSMQ